MDYGWLFGENSEISEDSPSQSFEVSEPIWTTKDGEKIPLSKMETRHIRNCIRLLESRGKFKHKWYRIFQDELERRKASPLETSFFSDNKFKKFFS